MLRTPASFTPLMAPQDHAEPLTFLFFQGRLLVREDDLSLPDAAAVARLELGAAPAASARPAGRALLPGRLGRARRRAGRRLRLARPALAVRRDGRRAAGAGRTRRPAGRMGAHAPLLRRLRHAMQLAAGERCFKCPLRHLAYPRISPAMMVLIRKGDSVLLAHAQRVADQAFQPAGRLPRGGRIGGGGGAPRSVRGSRPARAQPAIFLQPVVAVPAFADDRFHGRLSGRRDPRRPASRSPTRAGSAPATPGRSGFRTSRCRAC